MQFDRTRGNRSKQESGGGGKKQLKLLRDGAGRWENVRDAVCRMFASRFRSQTHVLGRAVARAQQQQRQHDGGAGTGGAVGVRGRGRHVGGAIGGACDHGRSVVGTRARARNRMKPSADTGGAVFGSPSSRVFVRLCFGCCRSVSVFAIASAVRPVARVF